MSQALATTLHVLVGTVALGAFWAAWSVRRGGPAHRSFGRVFFLAMLAVVLTVAPVLATAPGPFDPGRVVQMVYLSVCVGTVVTLGWTSVRWRRQPERFAGPHLSVLGAVLVALGALVLVAGLAKADPVPAVLSWVGLVFGTAMLRWRRRPGPPAANAWLSWHLDAIAGLFTAVHGTLSFVAWRELVMPDVHPSWAALAHGLVLLVALLLRWGLARRTGAPSIVFGGLLPALGDGGVARAGRG